MRRSLIVAFSLAALLMGSICVSARVEPTKKDLVKIRFVDSKGESIPYFSGLYVYLQPTEDLGHLKGYMVSGGVWDQLLPSQNWGGGIAPPRSPNPPYFVDTIDLAAEARRTSFTHQRYQEAHLPLGAGKVFVYYFPDGQVFILPYEEANKLARDKVNIVTIPGNLGSGQWKELGNFLFLAARQWRTGAGSQTDLLLKCDALIQKKKQAGDFQWAGNLVFVREHWLQANPLKGNYGREPKQVTAEELKPRATIT